MSDSPIFKIKNEPKTCVINSFRVTQETYDRLMLLSRMNSKPMQEVLRQMIDFALEHLEDK